MKPRSLRVRVLLAAAFWIVLAMAVGGIAVVQMFKSSALRQFDQGLEEELTLLSVAVANEAGDPAVGMTSPAFWRVYSGQYWQAESDGQIHLSRSLWDRSLAIPSGEGQMAYAADGPDNQRVRVLSRRLVTPDGRAWQIAVATDLATLDRETEFFMRGLIPAAAGLYIALLIAAILVLRTALAPLNQLRDAVRDAQSIDEAEIPEVFPDEVAPLVGDLNAMLKKNARLVARGQARAANLAHAMKTPAAVLRNEIDSVKSGGAMDVSVADDAIDQISAAATKHAGHSGARREDRPAGQAQDAVPALHQVVRVIQRIYPDLTMEVDAPARLDLPLVTPDLLELFGNLLENAAKWAKGRVSITLAPNAGGARLIVDDDGPGVAEEDRYRIVEQGVRLDETIAGKGLGLSIVAEIVEAEGGTLTLGDSPMGGLRVVADLPSGPSI